MTGFSLFYDFWTQNTRQPRIKDQFYIIIIYISSKLFDIFSCILAIVFSTLFDHTREYFCSSHGNQPLRLSRLS